MFKFTSRAASTFSTFMTSNYPPCTAADNNIAFVSARLVDAKRIDLLTNAALSYRLCASIVRRRYPKIHFCQLAGRAGDRQNSAAGKTLRWYFQTSSLVLESDYTLVGDRASAQINEYDKLGHPSHYHYTVHPGNSIGILMFQRF